MNRRVIPALAAALLTLAACDSRVETDPQTVPVPAVTDHVGEIAGDKTMTADVIRRSFEKGTFDDALSLAIADSALAAEVIGVLRADPRYAGLLQKEPATATSLAAKSTSSKSSTSRSSAQRSQSGGDPIDQAERTMNKTNEKLDQAARVRDQIDEARRKTEGIFRPR